MLFCFPVKFVSLFFARRGTRLPAFGFYCSDAALLSLTWWCVSIFQGLVNMQSQFHFTLVIFHSVVNTQMIKLTHTQRHMGLD